MAALREGMMPENKVRAVLMSTSTKAVGRGRKALKVWMPVRWCRMALMGMHLSLIHI